MTSETDCTGVYRYGSGVGFGGEAGDCVACGGEIVPGRDVLIEVWDGEYLMSLHHEACYRPRSGDPAIEDGD